MNDVSEDGVREVGLNCGKPGFIEASEDNEPPSDTSFSGLLDIEVCLARRNGIYKLE